MFKLTRYVLMMQAFKYVSFVEWIIRRQGIQGAPNMTQVKIKDHISVAKP